ncbi:hypothetical protein FB559_5329 [Actinoallomurus bryophytorum]|uniref:Uncharacterized protein n=1 Tax=Actinoallomurus bryophytorum TaxID=1490222 RepID=A0A543CR98_9ACTN|nr:hypothetical protein FB559_5329 [Actinoallomurus bryophytorum]
MRVWELSLPLPPGYPSALCSSCTIPTRRRWRKPAEPEARPPGRSPGRAPGSMPCGERWRPLLPGHPSALPEARPPRRSPGRAPGSMPSVGAVAAPTARPPQRPVFDLHYPHAPEVEKSRRARPLTGPPPGPCHVWRTAAALTARPAEGTPSRCWVHAVCRLMRTATGARRRRTNRAGRSRDRLGPRRAVLSVDYVRLGCSPHAPVVGRTRCQGLIRSPAVLLRDVRTTPRRVVVGRHQADSLLDLATRRVNCRSLRTETPRRVPQAENPDSGVTKLRQTCT